jgi:uracil phosphoribosyltransferase
MPQSSPICTSCNRCVRLLRVGFRVWRKLAVKGRSDGAIWQTTQLRGIHTIIRDKACERSDFVFQSDRLIRMVVEEALSLLPTEGRTVTTPTGVEYEGLRFGSKLCAVSIPRSGDTMEQGVRQVIRDVRIGKILIQRHEHTAKPVLLYSKLPLDIANRIVLLLDPMLATGGSGEPRFC